MGGVLRRLGEIDESALQIPPFGQGVEGLLGLGYLLGRFCLDIEGRGTAHDLLADEDEIAARVRRHFALKPAGIIESLDLLRPIFCKTASYGHFGRDDPDFTWERTDKVDALKAS